MLVLVRDPGARLRDVALMVGITERAVQRIVAELEAAGYLTRIRSGRTNRYKFHGDRPLRHQVEAHRRLADLLLLAGPAEMSESQGLAEYHA